MDGTTALSRFRIGKQIKSSAASMVRSLKEAWQLGGRLRVKCDSIRGSKEAHRNKSLGCHRVHELDMKTLVWTPGQYSRLAARAAPQVSDFAATAKF
jgi:hypothetical protein